MPLKCFFVVVALFSLSASAQQGAQQQGAQQSKTAPEQKSENSEIATLKGQLEAAHAEIARLNEVIRVEELRLAGILQYLNAGEQLRQMRQQDQSAPAPIKEGKK